MLLDKFLEGSKFIGDGSSNNSGPSFHSGETNVNHLLPSPKGTSLFLTKPNFSV